MQVSHFTVMTTAAIVWYGGGIALLLKAGSLAKGAYAIDPDSPWTWISPLLGIAAGIIKGIFLFSKSCKKNIIRIRGLKEPKLWQCFRPGMLLFLAIIIPTGAMMSRAAAGKFGYLCLVCGVDLSIGFALLTSSVMFWKLKAFAAVK